MKLIITIEMNNAAFRDGNGREVARILESLVDEIAFDQLREEGIYRSLYDSNGLRVGKVEVRD